MHKASLQDDILSYYCHSFATDKAFPPGRGLRIAL